MPDFSAVRILCVGDVMLDRFVSGDVERISPEAPVPIFRWTSERSMLGGAGNVVANLRALGIATDLVCRLGRDAEGQRVKQLLSDEKAALHCVESDAVPTIQKTRFVAKGHHVLRMDRERVVSPDAEEEARLVSVVTACLASVDLVILSDYAKGLLSPSFCRQVIAAARAVGMPVYVDPKGNDYSKYAGATLVKPNRRELELVCGLALDPSSPKFLACVVSSARTLLERVGIESAVVTLSERGMVYVAREGGEVLHLPTEGREVCDVSGAGDTTMAVLAAARAAGAPIREAMNLANVAAGLVVGKIGTATVTGIELENALTRRESHTPSFGRKVLTLDELRRRVGEWRSDGETVGFTNGCFDCLHCGHLSSLYQAKEHCDRLVVGLNSDASVRRLKGATRPIQDERTRSLVLAGLECVDAVVLFGEDTALPLVEALRPDVIAKEGYTVDRWPEARFVEASGGRAVVLRRVDGYSTSDLVRRMEVGHE